MALKFAKVNGAGSSAPVQSAPASAPTEAEVAAAKPVNNEAAAPVAAPQNLPVPSSGTTAMGFYQGTEDDQEFDPRDIKLPRLNLTQEMSAADLKGLVVAAKGGGEGVGEFVFSKNLWLPQPLRVVVAGVRPKRWVEKTKYGSGKEPRYADSLVEVQQQGGTDQWKLSKENDKIESNKAWFMPMVTMLLLIERPASAPEEWFPYVVGDKQFVAALFTVKSTSFGSFYVPINSEKVQGRLTAGYNTRYITVTARKNKAWEPVPAIAEPTSEEVRALARQAVGA